MHIRERVVELGKIGYSKFVVRVHSFLIKMRTNNKVGTDFIIANKQNNDEEGKIFKTKEHTMK
jgi:hypothetical protein